MISTTLTSTTISMLSEEISTTYSEGKRKATTKTNYKIVSMTLKRSSPSAMTYLAEKHHLLYLKQTLNRN